MLVTVLCSLLDHSWFTPLTWFFSALSLQMFSLVFHLCRLSCWLSRVFLHQLIGDRPRNAASNSFACICCWRYICVLQWCFPVMDTFLIFLWFQESEVSGIYLAVLHIAPSLWLLILNNLVAMIVNNATMLYWCSRVRLQSALSFHFECQPTSLCVELVPCHHHSTLPSVGWNFPPVMALQRACLHWYASAAGSL
jgi:hypothetical protein